MKFVGHRAAKQLSSGLLVTMACLFMVAAFPAAAEPSTQIEATPKHDLHHGNAWINDVGTLLYGDTDRDSFFTGMSLTIDADSSYNSTQVYVAIDLTGPDQQIIRLHTTSDFYLYGTSSTDEYRIDIDLVRNYEPARYDITLSLIDARSRQILDRVGANEFSNLRRLPLESEDRDNDSTQPNDSQPDNNPAPNNDVRVVEYGGGAGLAFCAMLMVLLLCRRQSRQLNVSTARS